MPWLFLDDDAHAVMYSLLATAVSKTCANSGDWRESFFSAGRCPSAAPPVGAAGAAGASAGADSDIAYASCENQTKRDTLICQFHEHFSFDSVSVLITCSFE